MSPEELLISKGIEYKVNGNDLLVKCLNPDHDDSNPSMRIDRTIGIFNCLSCGFKGNIYKHFNEKVKGLYLKTAKLKKKILEKRTESVGYNMPKNSIPYRGSWRDISPDTYSLFDAFESSSPDYIGRINFPIRNISGNIIGFIGRHTGDGVPRYKISPSDIKMPFFPLHLVKPVYGKVILVEGIYDMLRCYDAGITNVIAVFGTSMVSEEKLKLLQILGVTGLDLFFDSDEAGKAATEKVKELAESMEFDVRVIKYNAKDPGSLTVTQLNTLARKLYG